MIVPLLVAILVTALAAISWARAIERQAQLKQAALTPIVPSLPLAVAIPTAFRRSRRSTKP